MNKHDLIQKLGMQMHPEGGYFSETYRSKTIIETDREGSSRAVLTLLYTT
ncbi:cupin domain-containing protein [Moorena sp. SIO1G6]|nr:cupin domain-containing protein [Moorena sp. SIO1G6]